MRYTVQVCLGIESYVESAVANETHAKHQLCRFSDLFRRFAISVRELSLKD